MWTWKFLNSERKSCGFKISVYVWTAPNCFSEFDSKTLLKIHVCIFSSNKFLVMVS